MKYIAQSNETCHTIPILELTRRNLETLLEKLDDPHSARTLFDGPYNIGVRAVENDCHYADRAPGPVYTNGVEK